EVIGVLDAGIEPLTSRWRMRMRGVTDQKHPIYSVAIGQSRIHVEGRCPGYRCDANVVAPRAFGHHCGNIFNGEIDVALGRYRCLYLKQFSAAERAERDLAIHIALVEAMPGIAFQTRQGDIGDHAAHAKRLARKPDAEHLAHETAPTIGTDEIARTDELFTDFAGELHRYPILILLQADQLASEMRPVPEFNEAIAHHPFSEELRHHPGEGIGFGRGRVHMLRHVSFGEAAVVAIFPLRRVAAAGGSNAVKNAEVLEDLLRSRLDALAARTAERAVHLLDQAERDTAPRQLYREREAGRTGTANQHVGRIFLCHRSPNMCIMHTIGGMVCRPRKECKMHIFPSRSGLSTERC